MPAVPTLSCIPCRVEAGTTVVFSSSHRDYPSDEWTLAEVLNNGVVAANFPGVANGDDDGFTVTMTAAATSELTAGRYARTQIFTNIGDSGIKRAGDRSTVDVLPNPAVAPAPTFEQAQVTLLKTALASLAASTRSSVTFNGQSFTRSNVADYQRQLVYWEARVIAANRASAHLRGERTGNAIASIGVSFERVEGWDGGWIPR